MGVTTERRRKHSPTYLQGLTMQERPHTLQEYAQDHFRYSNCHGLPPPPSKFSDTLPELGL